MTTTRTMFDQFSSGNDTTKSSGFRPRWSTTHSARNTIATKVRAHADLDQLLGELESTGARCSGLGQDAVR